MAHVDDLNAYTAAKLVLFLATEERERLCLAHTRRVDLIQALNLVIEAARNDTRAKRLVAAASMPPPPP